MIGGIRTCLGVSDDPMFLWISSNSCPLNLLLVQSHQAEIIIVKRLIQGRNSVIRVRVEPRSFDQGCPKNDAFTHSAMLPTISPIFALKQIFEKFWEYGKDLFACFVDLEKAYDQVPRDKLWKVLQEYGINGQLLRFIKSFYRPVGRAVTHSSLEREVRGQLSGQSNRTQCCQWLATAATFLQKKLCCSGAMTQRWAPQTHYTLRRNRASIMKDLI